MDEVERRLRAVNLNMLPVLRAILKHRNLTRAAEELNLTQSAVSNILKRLRDHFDDDLLIRDGRQFRLTERANRLFGPLDDAMRALSQVVRHERFDPATATHRFRIAAADHVTATTLPRMAAMIATEAPRIAIQAVTPTGRSSEQLLSDAIDIIISPKQVIDPLMEASGRLRRTLVIEPLIEEPFVCIQRASGDDSARALSLADYAGRAHATFALEVNFAASLEQSYLDEHNLKQFNRIITSEFTLLPLIVSQSDCVALVPRSIANLAARSLPITITPSPIPVPDLAMVAVWNRRRHDEPELTWLRALLRRSLEGI